MVSLNDLNFFKGFSFNIFGSGVTNTIIIFVIGLLIFVLIGFFIFMWADRRKYWISIPLYKKIGNIVTRVKFYKAKQFAIGQAGDCLWFVRGVNKYLPPGTIQSAPNEFMHYEREDGEWINFAMGDLDEDQKKAGVKYIHQDMRAQRIATANLLEQRLMQKTFWEKWGVVVGYVIFFLVITVAVVMNLYMMGKVIQDMKPLVSAINEGLSRVLEAEKGQNSILPAFALFILRKFKFNLKRDSDKNEKGGEVL